MSNEDDLFCQKLLEEYEQSNDKGEFIDFDEAAKLCDVDIWDSDFTKLTPAERERLERAEAETEVVNFDDIDWN